MNEYYAPLRTEGYSITSEIQGFNTSLTKVCNDVTNNISMTKLTGYIQSGIGAVFDNVITAPIVLAMTGVGVVVDGASSVVNTAANTVGGLVNGTLTSLNSGIGGIFTGLNNIANGTLSSIDAVTTNLDKGNVAEVYRYNTTKSAFDALNLYITNFNGAVTDLQSKFTTVNNEWNKIQSVSAIVNTAQAFQSAVGTWNGKLTGIGTYYNNTISNNISTMISAAPLAQIKTALDNNTLTTAAAQQYYDSVKASQQTAATNWNVILSDANTYWPPVVTAYNNFVTAFNGLDDANKNAVMSYMQALDAYVASGKSFVSLCNTIKDTIAKIATTIVNPATEPYADNLPFTQMSVPTNKGEYDIFKFKQLPLIYVTNKQHNVHFYQLNQTVYYLLQGEGITIEYLNTPYLKGQPNFQLVLLHVPGKEEPFVFSNYIRVQDVQVVAHCMYVREGYDMLSDMIDKVNSTVVNPALGWIGQLKDKAVNAVKGVLGPIRALVGTLTSTVSCVYDNISNLVQQIPNLASSDPSKNPVYGAVTAVWDGSKKTFDAAVDGVKTVGNKIKNNAYKISGTVMDQLKTTWNNTTGVFTTTINGVMTTISTIESKVKDLINFVIKLPGKIYTKLQGAATTISSYLNPMNIINSVKNVIDATPDSSACVSDVSSNTTCQNITNSVNGKYSLMMNSDGDLRLLDNCNNKLWSTQTAGKGVLPYKLVMQSDGNLVLVDKNNAVMWSSQTANKGVAPFTFRLGDDASLSIKDKTGLVTWSVSPTLVTCTETFGFMGENKKWWVWGLVAIVLLLIAYFVWRKK